MYEILTKDDLKMHAQWLQTLREEERWRSALIGRIIRILVMMRDIYPGDASIIFDESVFFLDILQVAIEDGLGGQCKVFRYDGRQSPVERDYRLQQFRESADQKVMLLSRSAGGQGLNIQSANIVIRCGPWWKQTWEEQADSRSWRPGQTKKVHVFDLFANNAEVSWYIRRSKTGKNKTNKLINNGILEDDGSEDEKGEGMQGVQTG